jgi:hypothetical protein
MKLFMIPQTVPNRPTKGAVAPMVARTPVPRLMRRLQRRLEPFQPGVDALLQTIFVGDPLAQAEFCDRFPAKARRRLFKVGKFGVSQSLNGVERGKRGPGLPARFHEFDCLGEPHRPGDDRSDDQANHDDFHHHVGAHEHSPRRQVAWQNSYRFDRCIWLLCTSDVRRAGTGDCQDSAAGFEMFLMR